jgi:hypothetical protein
MKEQLQSKLVEILTSIQAAAGKASDFAMAELPDIAQSYIAYGRAMAIAQIVFSTLLFIALVYVTHRCVIWVKKEEEWAMSPLLSIPVTVTAMVAGWAYASITSALLVWMAPKVWLLKEIAGMLR